MCKLGDIIVVKEFKNEVGEIIKKHSFIVINEQKGSIEGINFDLVCNMMCSFHNEEHKKRKLRFKENLEISGKIISNKKINAKHGFIKANQVYYFDKTKIEYNILGQINDELLNELLKLVIVLNKEGKLKIITTNLKNKTFN